jgi:hypothetical protein
MEVGGCPSCAARYLIAGSGATHTGSQVAAFPQTRPFFRVSLMVLSPQTCGQFALAAVGRYPYSGTVAFYFPRTVLPAEVHLT